MFGLTALPQLATGSHPAGSGYACIMNAIAYMSGDEKITDTPGCVTRVLAHLGQRHNDSICTEGKFGTSTDEDGDQVTMRILCPDCTHGMWMYGARVIGSAEAFNNFIKAQVLQQPGMVSMSPDPIPFRWCFIDTVNRFWVELVLWANDEADRMYPCEITQAIRLNTVQALAIRFIDRSLPRARIMTAANAQHVALSALPVQGFDSHRRNALLNLMFVFMEIGPHAESNRARHFGYALAQLIKSVPDRELLLGKILDEFDRRVSFTAEKPTEADVARVADLAKLVLV